MADYAERAIAVHWLDWAVIVVYLAALIAIGFYHSRRQKDISDYFLAAKSMSWLPIGLSLMAALNSGSDYLMQPSAMVQYGPIILTGPLSWFLLYPYVFFVILPFYRRLPIYTAYEYLESRFDPKVRTLAAGIFLVWQSMISGMALYVPCLAMSAAMRRDDLLLPMIVIIGLVVTIYTMLGGMKGVVWVDVAQFFVMFAGLTATIIIVLINVPNGIGSFFGKLSEVGIDLKAYEIPKIEGSGFVYSTAHSVKEYFLIPMTATGILWVTALGRLNIYTCNQVMVQRFQSTKTIRDARQGFFITAIGDFMWVMILSLMGVFLFTYYTQDGALPEYFRENTDRILPVFMADVFPIGMTGLVIAAIWAAALSGFDGVLNSMATVTMIDFVNRLWLRVKPGSPEDTPALQRAQVILSRVFTLLFGLLAIVIASNAHRMGTLVEIGMKIVGSFSGPILGIFLLGMFWRRATSAGVFWGGLLGTLAAFYGVLWTSPPLTAPGAPLSLLRAIVPNPEIYRPISPMWLGAMGLIVMAGFAVVISLLTRPNEDAREWTWRHVVRRSLEE